EILWPRSEFFARRGRRQDGGDGLLLFCGPEPHQRWRTYTKAFLDVAERCGVRRIVSLGALLASAPHTRPIRVTARCTDPAVRSLEQQYDAAADEERQPLPHGELDSEKLMRELQDFLRKQGEAGAEGR